MIKKIETISDEVKELHPILQILLPKLPNVIQVEYTHGTNEMGADFVLCKKDETFGTDVYVGIIAKIGKIVQNFSDIERQIEECDIERYFMGGREKIFIREIWIINNDTITQGAQTKINKKYSTRRITFINGDHLSQLVEKYIPNYWSSLPLKLGEYLSSTQIKSEEIDRSTSLFQTEAGNFYIEQDIYENQIGNYSKSSQISPRMRQVNIFKEVESHDILLIEGGMGAGKSKLLRHIISHYTDPENFTDSNLLPVYVSFSKLLDDFEGDIEKYLSSVISNEIVSELGEGKILLLIDGLDEKKLDIDDQIDFIINTQTSIKLLKNIKVIITTRYIKELEKENLLDSSIKRYKLPPLAFKRTIEFLTKLCDSLNLTNRIVEDLKKSQLFRNLPQSPIAAILLAKIINENSEDLPQNLTELYSKYMELMLGRWDIDKGLQSQKEYQALDNILIDFSKFILDYEMPNIPLTDAKTIINDYLSKRNLGVDSSKILNSLLSRCEILSYDSDEKVIYFKHRSFAEFFYGKGIERSNNWDLDNRAFRYYWINSIFFGLGIRRDCMDILPQINLLEPKNEQERWMKIINLGQYYLAAYSSPYEDIVDGITLIMCEAAKLYLDIIEHKIESPFSEFSRMSLLFLFQYMIRQNYSYTFFIDAIESAALQITDMRNCNKTIQAYALFFLNVTYIELGINENFDLLLTNIDKELPLDIMLALRHESETLKERTQLMRKQDSRIKRLVKGNDKLKSIISNYYDQPINK